MDLVQLPPGLILEDDLLCSGVNLDVHSETLSLLVLAEQVPQLVTIDLYRRDLQLEALPKLIR